MTLAHLKAHAAHWAQPVVGPVLALIGGASVADATGALLPVNVWVEIAQVIVVLVMLRSIVFLEFRVHEAREKRLYDGIVKTGDSFDRIWRLTDDRLERLEEWRRALAEDRANDADRLAAQDRRLRLLEEHPVLRRLGGPGNG